MPLVKVNPIFIAFSYLGVILTFSLWSTAIILRRLLFLPLKWEDNFTLYCAIGVSASLRITTVCENKEIYNPNEAAIMIANHSSMVDIPAVYMASSGRIRMLAKKEIAYIPLLGWALWAGHHVAVDRGKRSSAGKARERLALYLGMGYQIFLFAEGTRSSNGCLLPFKTGAFRMAAEHKVPIYVLALKKPWEILPKGSLALKHQGKIRAKFLGRISPLKANNESKTHQELLDEARALYIEDGFLEC